MGLVLATLAGPIFFTLVQTGIERGVVAGFAVGLGEWSSDLLYIAAAYFGLVWLNKHLDQAVFTYYVGIIGGLVLMGFGLASILHKTPLVQDAKPITAKNLLGYFAKGFAINTFNPFTLIFWIGTTGAYVIKGGYSGAEAAVFYGSIIGTIAFFDMLKVWAAKQVRAYMKPAYMLWLRRISGLALIIFGLVLLIRVLF